MKHIRKTVCKIIFKGVFYILLLIFWELLYQVGVNYLKIWKSYSFPSPFSVIVKLISLFRDRTLLIAISVSLKRIVIGFFISTIIGVFIGLIITKTKFIGNNLKPLILGLQTLPSICWLPFAILWYGLNESAIIFIIVIGSTFAIAIAIESGFKNVNPIYIKAAKTMGAKGLYLYINVIFPAAIPNIIAGLKQAWSFAWRALMAGEMMSATVGLGQVLMMGRDLADINQVMAVMLAIVFIGWIVDKMIFEKLESNVRERWGLKKA